MIPPGKRHKKRSLTLAQVKKELEAERLKRLKERANFDELQQNIEIWEDMLRERKFAFDENDYLVEVQDANKKR